MYSDIQMSIAKSRQEDLIARSELRRLAKAVKNRAASRKAMAEPAAHRTCACDLG